MNEVELREDVYIKTINWKQVKDIMFTVAFIFGINTVSFFLSLDVIGLNFLGIAWSVFWGGWYAFCFYVTKYMVDEYQPKKKYIWVERNVNNPETE